MLKKKGVNSVDAARKVLVDNGLRVRNVRSAYVPVTMTVEGESVIIKPRIAKGTSTVKKVSVARRYNCHPNNGTTVVNGKRVKGQLVKEEEQKPQCLVTAEW